MALPPADSLGTPGALSSGRRDKLVVYLGREAKDKPADKAPPPEAGRDTAEAIVVCKSPDVCKTPVGAATPPIPYQITSKMGDDANTATSVHLTKLKAFKWDSHTTHVTGDEPGSAKGVKSGTVGDIAEPKTHSSTVRTEKQWLIRDGDEFWMNRRNTVGDAIYKKNRKKAPPQDLPRSKIDDSEAEALIAKAQAQGWTIEYVQTNQIKRESAYIQRSGSSTMLAQAVPKTVPGNVISDVPAFKPNIGVPSNLGPAANDNLLKLPSSMAKPPGGALGALGKASKAAGPILFLLWIAQGAPMPGDNRILAEGSAKDALKGLEPQGPEEKALYDKAYGALADHKEAVLEKWNPFSGPGYSDHDAAVRKSLEDAYAQLRAKKKEEKERESADPKAEPGKDGARVSGDPCDVREYKDRCPKDGSEKLYAHHIVKDMVLRYGTRYEADKRIENTPSLDEGPTMCLTKEEHDEVHQRMDKKIRELGNRTDNGPKGMAPLDEIIEIAIQALADTKPSCRGKFEDKVRQKFKNVPEGTLGRTQQKPLPKPEVTPQAPE